MAATEQRTVGQGAWNRTTRNDETMRDEVEAKRSGKKRTATLRQGTHVLRLPQHRRLLHRFSDEVFAGANTLDL